MFYSLKLQRKEKLRIAMKSNWIFRKSGGCQISKQIQPKLRFQKEMSNSYSSLLLEAQ